MTDPLKKCLLIGINYEDSDMSLNGCINDSENLKQFLLSNSYFDPTDFTMMNDHLSGDLYPTKSNIEKQLKALVTFASAHPDEDIEMFVSYSGHGYNIKDNDGDESDGRDEVLCPVDCMTRGFITDDWLKSEFVDKLHKKVRLVMLVDACHSGTMLDLRFNYMVNNFNSYTIHEDVEETGCKCIMISGCKDSQTSADAWLKDGQEGGYESQGAMTASFINCYNDGITYRRLIRKMRRWLKKKNFDQVPQLSSGKYVNTRKKMLLSVFD